MEGRRSEEGMKYRSSLYLSGGTFKYRKGKLMEAFYLFLKSERGQEKGRKGAFYFVCSLKLFSGKERVAVRG